MPGPVLSVSIPHRPPNVTANANGSADANDSHSRSSSLNSHSPSIQSAANSTRYMLAGMNNNSSGLDPPTLPYGSRSGSYRSMSPKNDTPLMDNKGIPTSLSVNYLPSKFSSHVLTGGMKRRKGKGGGDIPIPKRGGGREAFRANESRMPGDGDDDYDGVTFGQGGRKGRLRWNRFKWVLFISNLVVSNVFPYTLRVVCFSSLARPGGSLLFHRPWAYFPRCFTPSSGIALASGGRRSQASPARLVSSCPLRFICACPFRACRPWCEELQSPRRLLPLRRWHSRRPWRIFDGVTGAAVPLSCSFVPFVVIDGSYTPL